AVVLPDGGSLAIADDLLIDEGHEERVTFVMDRCAGDLRARAVDGVGVPIVGLRVRLYTWAGVADSVVTDAAGHADFQDIDCGEYGVDVTGAPGVEPIAPPTPATDGLVVSESARREIELVF